MKFRPLHDRVLIEVLDSEEKTAGGIIIPDSAKEKEAVQCFCHRDGRELAGAHWSRGQVSWWRERS